MVEVKLLPDAQGQFLELTTTAKERVRKVFVRLKKWPEVSGAVPLRNELAGQFKVRTGDYRVQGYYQPKDNSVYIVKVGHRDGFYE